MGDYVVELEVSLGNRSVWLTSPADLSFEEAERVQKFLLHHGIISVVRKIHWKEAELADLQKVSS